MSEIKYLDIKEFQQKGLLFEANRQFFHPLGLALEINTDEDGKTYLSGIWDYRDDPEGMGYGEKLLSSDGAYEKAKYVHDLKESKRDVREKTFGAIVQPLS
jgi:hypothetical protein